MQPAAGTAQNFINVETVDLTTRGITIPADRVGMVVAQPFISLSDTEPFRCEPAAKADQLKILTDTLQISMGNTHGAPKTHFTVFPEYCIPGLDGINQIQNVLESGDWPSATVVIGGTDALSKDEFTTLAGRPNTHLDTTHNSPDRMNENEWVNCGITWVKGQDGKVETWLQPKLHPAWEEMNISYQSMFRGQSIYVFKGTLANEAPYRFGTLVCFDWIATVGTQKICARILDDLHQQANGHQLPFSWLFVIQRNPKPSHNTFLKQVEMFFDETQFPNARRDRACLIFANNAGRVSPGRIDKFGGCSVVLSPQSLFMKPDCALTYSNGGKRFRDGSDLLNPYKDVFFRERGACIHSFIQVNPGSLVAGAAGRELPVEDARVYPFSGPADPRTPSAPVAASVKWLNDELDDLPSLAKAYSTLPLAQEVAPRHEENVGALRALKAQGAAHSVRLASQGSTAKNADEWDQIEREALEHLVSTLDLVSLSGTTPTISADPAHATLEFAGDLIDIAAVRGDTHEACIEHSKRIIPLSRRKVLLVSRDRDNNDWTRKFGSFLEPETGQLGQEKKITDPASGTWHVGYRNLLSIYQNSKDLNEAKGAINGQLAA